jgi:hypothetical protein
MALDTEKLDQLRLQKAKYRELQRQADEAKAAHDELQADVFEDMRQEGHMSYKSDKASFSRKSTLYGTVQDRDAFIEWCHENDLADEFLKEKEVAQRINEIVRGAIDNGEDLPPGLGFYARQYISITEGSNG